MSNLTPGPWNATQFGDIMGPFGASKIARLYGPNMKSNACLIAASPDLLSALKDMVEMFEAHINGEEGPDDVASRWDKARMAIAKAEGIKVITR